MGLILWFTGFITLGGEWFLMWQSQDWNAEQTAFRLFVIFGITLVYLTRSDRQDDA
jgi:predicted small integral membrane protein